MGVLATAIPEAGEGTGGGGEAGSGVHCQSEGELSWLHGGPECTSWGRQVRTMPGMGKAREMEAGQ